MKTPLVLRYFLWSMLIFAVSMFSLSFRIFDTLQYKTLTVGTNMRTPAYWRSMREVDIPFRVLPILGTQLNQDQYFEIVREVVHRLKTAGAKVVIVPIPDTFSPSPRVDRTILQIAADSIVVFGSPGPLNSALPWEHDLRIEDKKTWWARHPFSNRLKVPWGVMSSVINYESPLVRFVPVGFRESQTGDPVSDVATIALKRYVGIPDNEELPFSRSRFVVGSMGIQTGRDGVSYIRMTYGARQQFEMSAALNVATDSVEYFPSAGETTEKAWRNHNGKIVMIDWMPPRPSQSVFNRQAYFQIFSSVFNGTFLTIHSEWNVLLITTLVVFLSLFSYTVRSGWMVVVSLLLAVASLVVSGWLFTEYNVIFDPLYILLPILLCGILLPLVKMAGEKHLAEERIRSLEEENRRLVDLQSPSSRGMLP